MFKFCVWNILFIVLLLINRTKAEIDLSLNACWNQTGIAIIGSTSGGTGASLSQLDGPVGMSISREDVLYITDSRNARIVVVHPNSNISNFVIGSGWGPGLSQFKSPQDSFVTSTSLYVTDTSNYRVKNLSLNGSNPSIVSYVNSPYDPYYLYVDNDANIYVSCSWNHIVLLFYPNATNFSIAAGNGTAGSNNRQVNTPYGIFVNQVGTVYIADRNNHRIMKWLSGATSGILAAGTGIAGRNSTQISSPTQIIVDTNGYMYISESGSARITRWGPNATFGICIAACTGMSGTALTQLSSPHSLVFDSTGSLYVCDWANNRVQKFQILPRDACEFFTDATTTAENMLTSTFDKLQTSANAALSTAASSTTASSTAASSIEVTATSHQNVQRLSIFFVPPLCSNKVSISPTCNVSSALCDILEPCRNNGTCINSSISSNGYVCSCSAGFGGNHCEFDDRACRPNTCWHSGTCIAMSNTAFICLCTRGWEGIRCEIMVNYCRNITCRNHGVCRPLFLNYSCECLNGSYSGSHCEMTTTRMNIYKIISKSLGYVAIIAIITVAMFVIVTDVLTYGFGIDPVEEERKRIRRTKRKNKRKPVIQRFVYVNAPQLPSSNPITVIPERTV